VALAAGAAGPGGTVGAQGQAATVTGRIIDKTTRTPIMGADVILALDGRKVSTDSLGRFTLPVSSAGQARLIIRAAGFPVGTFDLTIELGDRLEPLIQLDSTAAAAAGDPQALPTVSVTTPMSRGPRYADFERRLKTGRGQYFTRETLARGGMSTLLDALRTARGVQVECGGGAGCFARMTRAPMQCKPDYWVDDRLDNIFGPRTPIQDIEALEVYAGAADVPGEYAGRTAGCGVIVIWTRSGPPRRRP
jgi:hypothetical protein